MPPPAKKPRVDDPNPPKDAKENEGVSAKGATANGQAVSDASSSASSLSATAAQGAPPIAAPDSNAQAAAAPPVPVFGLLSMDTQQDHDTCLGNWVAKTTTYVEKSLLKFLSERPTMVAFQIPSSLLLIPPLEINSAASDAHLSSFREVMNYDNLMKAFSHSGQYEAAGTVWMLDVKNDKSRSESITISQLEGAMQMWSEQTLLLSSNHAPSRRYSFDVPLPVMVVDKNVAQRKEKGKGTVVMAQPLRMLAGHAVVMAWYGAIAESLQAENNDRVFKLFEAALSVPIRLRLCPDGDDCHLASLYFAESLYASFAASGADSFWKLAEKIAKLSPVAQAIADNISIPTLTKVIQKYGLTFRGKPISETGVKALKAVIPFVVDAGCNAAYSLTESFCPEIREATMLMRIAQLSAARLCSTVDKETSARASLRFVFDCLRVFRLTGDFPKDDVYTIAKITGQEKKSPALVHSIFKKQEIVEFIFHEVELVDNSLLASVDMFRTPLTLMKKFSASGGQDLVTAFRDPNSASGEGFETMFAVPVAEYRDADIHSTKVQALIDFLWSLWSGMFDEEIMSLCDQDMKAVNPSFLWHRYLNDNPQGMGAKYRVFVEACMGGPTPTGPIEQILIGTSELSEDDKKDLIKVQEMLKALRRKTVSFVTLPSIGGSSGGDYSKAQMEKVWENMRLGHRFPRKKTDVRAFVLSADLFPPNVAKHGVESSMSVPISADATRMQRAIEFMIQKRSKDDIIILFDGRSKSCRRVMEEYEDKLGASGAHSVSECWIVYALPQKTQDPRMPRKQMCFANNNKEVVIISQASKKGGTKIFHRAEFNLCGEISTASTTYTGVPVRRYCELPRMGHDVKSTILGVEACNTIRRKGVQKDIDEHGHPFSQCEVKPLSLWQQICEHHQVTHIVDFAAGSGALAIAATGAMEYEGVVANDVHLEWLDSTLDLCVMYMTGNNKELAEKLGGGDAAFADKVVKYFGGTLMEARRLLEPPPASADAEDGDEVSDASVD